MNRTREFRLEHPDNEPEPNTKPQAPSRQPLFARPAPTPATRWERIDPLPELGFGYTFGWQCPEYARPFMLRLHSQNAFFTATLGFMHADQWNLSVIVALRTTLVSNPTAPPTLWAARIARDYLKAILIDLENEIETCEAATPVVPPAPPATP